MSSEYFTVIIFVHDMPSVTFNRDSNVMQQSNFFSYTHFKYRSRTNIKKRPQFNCEEHEVTTNYLKNELLNQVRFLLLYFAFIHG